MMFRWCFGVDIFAQMVYWNRLPNTIKRDVDNGMRPLARLPPRASAISQPRAKALWRPQCIGGTDPAPPADCRVDPVSSASVNKPHPSDFIWSSVDPNPIDDTAVIEAADTDDFIWSSLDFNPIDDTAGIEAADTAAMNLNPIDDTAVIEADDTAVIEADDTAAIEAADTGSDAPFELLAPITFRNRQEMAPRWHQGTIAPRALKNN